MGKNVKIMVEHPYDQSERYDKRICLYNRRKLILLAPHDALPPHHRLLFLLTHTALSQHLTGKAPSNFSIWLSCRLLNWKNACSFVPFPSIRLRSLKLDGKFPSKLLIRLETAELAGELAVISKKEA
jgi:hypothetical protein